MADLPISGLPAVVTPLLTDQHAVNQGGITKKETNQQVQAITLNYEGSTLGGTGNLIVNSINSTLDSPVTNSQIFGGDDNEIKGSGTNLSTITGGNANTIIGAGANIVGSAACTIGGDGATIIGSVLSTASLQANILFGTDCSTTGNCIHTIVSGQKCKALLDTQGAWGWSDSFDLTDFNISVDNSFNVRARGGGHMVLGSAKFDFNTSGVEGVRIGDIGNVQMVSISKKGLIQDKDSVSNGTVIGTYRFDGDSGSGPFAGAQLTVTADEVPTATATPMSIEWEAQNTDTATDSTFTMHSDGSVILKATGVATTTRTLNLDFASQVRIDTGQLVVGDGIEFEGVRVAFVGQVVSASYIPQNTVRVIADGVISVGAPLTPSTTTAFRVEQISVVAPDSTPVIGFAVTSAAMAGDEIEVASAQLVKVRMDAVDTAALGDAIEKSDITVGRVKSSVGSAGTFGAAAETAGNNDFFHIWLMRNEQM